MGPKTDVGDAGEQNHPHSLPRFFAYRVPTSRNAIFAG